MITNEERRELRLARRLWALGNGDVFQGVTDPGDAKFLIRSLIIRHELREARAGTKADGSDINFAEAFAATYGEPLIQPMEQTA